MQHRTRDLLLRQRTQVINALRAHLAELGVVAAQGREGLKELLAVIADENDERLPVDARASLIVLAAQLQGAHSARGVILRPGSGVYRDKIQPGANRNLGRFRNRVIAICDAFWWSERLRSCGTRSRTLKKIPGSRNFWRDDPSRSWRWRSPTKWLVWPGRCWPRAVLIGRLRWRQRRKGTGDGRMRLRMCVHELQGVMTTLMRNGRDRRSENPLSATRGKNAC